MSTPFFKSSDEVLSQPEVYGFMKAVFGADVVYDAEPKVSVVSPNLHLNGNRRGHPEIKI